MKIYLAGPIFQCEDHECIDWREEAKRQLNEFEIVDPTERDYRGVTDENHRKIVEKDKDLIAACDILLVNHLKPSVGTSMEVLHAWQNKKQVFVISNGSENSPWLIYHAHKIFHTLEEAVSHIKQMN